jgi:arylsulfatase A-like enzyme
MGGDIKTSRRDFLKVGAAGLGAAVVPAGAPRAATAAAGTGDIRVDNVILIITDTLRRDALSCYGGHWIQTPHLDGFAQQAVIFENAFHSSFPTVPLRNDILTGRHTFTYKPWSPIDPDAVTLQETLGKAGILTSLVVDTPHPFTPGYNYQRSFAAWQVIRGQEADPFRSAPREVKLPCAPGKLREPEQAVKQYLRNVARRRREEDYFVAQTMATAAEWLEENRDGRRFFLYVDTFDPHEPWDPPHYYVERYDPGYNGEEVIYPRYDFWKEFLSERELQHCRALYAGEATLVDRWIGFLLDRIATLDLLKNTAVIITTDHGFYLGEHGYIGKALLRGGSFQYLPLYSEVARIPLLVYFPGCRGGTRLEALAQPVDFMPTILELMGVPKPPSVESHSLLPVLTGRAEKTRDLAIASPTLYNAGTRTTSPLGIEGPDPSARSSITNGEWLLVCGARPDKSAGPAYTAAVDSRVRQVTDMQGELRPELYHLGEDPGCLTNVISDKPTVATSLHQAYVDFLRSKRIPESFLQYFRNL